MRSRQEGKGELVCGAWLGERGERSFVKPPWWVDCGARKIIVDRPE